MKNSVFWCFDNYDFINNIRVLSELKVSIGFFLFLVTMGIKVLSEIKWFIAVSRLQNPRNG